MKRKSMGKSSVWLSLQANREPHMAGPAEVCVWSKYVKHKLPLNPPHPDMKTVIREWGLYWMQRIVNSPELNLLQWWEMTCRYMGLAILGICTQCHYVSSDHKCC